MTDSRAAPTWPGSSLNLVTTGVKENINTNLEKVQPQKERRKRSGEENIFNMIVLNVFICPLPSV